MKVYSLSNDGDHIACFNRIDEATTWAIENSRELGKYWSIEEADYDSTCDCHNEYLYLEPVKTNS